MVSNGADGFQWLSDECASHTTRSLRSLVGGWSGSTSIPRKTIRKQLEALNQRVAREVQWEAIKRSISEPSEAITCGCDEELHLGPEGPKQ